jgi:tRNA nucleotidyltransferase (CCA-adding enzyme)
MSEEARSTPLADARDGGELGLPAAGSGLVRAVLQTLADAGHEAAVVGGSLRDALLGLEPHDWDVATSALPEQVVALFGNTTWQNRYGTVTVHGDDGAIAQVTTYRAEGEYRDRRRPDDVRFGVSLVDDLARRDFTINAMAWAPLDHDPARGRLLDPFGGADDLRAGLLRAVGDPAERLREDALRLVRAVRFAHRFGLRIDPGTEAAIGRHASLAATVSGERLRDELVRILHPNDGAGGPPPSDAFRLMERLGLLEVVLPELAALRGIPQSKALPGDALDHTLRAVDAADPGQENARLAALCHDLGKVHTLANGRFIGHETVGAEIAATMLDRLRFPRAVIEAVVAAVRLHMFAYEAAWTDAAVRRFARRVGSEGQALLFALRRADNEASGAREPEVGGLPELERRLAAARAEAPLEPAQLAIDGNDLMRELGIEPGPAIGLLIERLMEAVLDDPALNDPATLLRMAHAALPEVRSATERR